MAEGADVHAVAPGALRLARVLDAPGTDPVCQRQQSLDWGSLAVQVHRDDGPGTGGYGGLHGVRVDQVRLVVSAIHEYRRGPCPADRLGGCDESIGRQDALVTRAD